MHNLQNLKSYDLPNKASLWYVVLAEFTRRLSYDSPEGSLFSFIISIFFLTVFMEIWSSSENSKAVLGSVEYFSEFLNSCENSQTNFRCLKQLSDVSSTSQKCETVFKSLKTFKNSPSFSEVSNSLRRSETVLGSVK